MSGCAALLASFKSRACGIQVRAIPLPAADVVPAANRQPVQARQNSNAARNFLTHTILASLFCRQSSTLYPVRVRTTKFTSNGRDK
jgi:hypothetical protein